MARFPKCAELHRMKLIPPVEVGAGSYKLWRPMAMSVNSMWETVMRQRAWCGSRWATLGRLAIVIVAGGMLVWASIGTPATSFGQRRQKEGCGG